MALSHLVIGLTFVAAPYKCVASLCSSLGCSRCCTLVFDGIKCHLDNSDKCNIQDKIKVCSVCAPSKWVIVLIRGLLYTKFQVGTTKKRTKGFMCKLDVVINLKKRFILPPYQLTLSSVNLWQPQFSQYI